MKETLISGCNCTWLLIIFVTMTAMKNKSLFFALALWFLWVPVFAANIASRTVTHVPIWTLMDSTSGIVLQENGQHKKVNPNDFVSLMTLYTALKIIEDKGISWSSTTSITSEDAALTTSQKRIFLIPNTPVSIETLLRSVAILGAEDSSLVLSSFLAATHENFAKKMNDFAAALSMRDSRFVSPIFHPDQVSSAYDLALLAVSIRREFPQVFAWFKEKDFSYSHHSQRNTNISLWKNDEIDGVMANTTCSELITSWSKKASSDRGVLAVLLKGTDTEKTISDALDLLKIGRTEYESICLFEPKVPIAKVEVLRGNREGIDVGALRAIWVPVSRKNLMVRGTGGLSCTLEYMSPLTAPIKENDFIGTLHVNFEKERIASFPIYALHDVGEGSSFNRFVHSVRMKLESKKNKIDKKND